MHMYSEFFRLTQHARPFLGCVLKLTSVHKVSRFLPDDVDSCLLLRQYRQYYMLYCLFSRVPTLDLSEIYNIVEISLIDGQ